MRNRRVTARPFDAAGQTSQFQAVLPSKLQVRRLRVIVSGLQVGDRHYHVALDWQPSLPTPEMPGKVGVAAERELYLSPGGAYTEADTVANDRRTASQKFVGFRANHGFAPQNGDRLFPVTRTKANPECDWVVGGRRYEFCCPPCIDEFVRWAKEEPERILAPEDYVC